jgi:peroxiredoxin
MGVRLLAISATPLADLRAVVAEQPYPFPLLADPACAAIDAYGLGHDDPEHGRISRPASFVLGADGVVQFAHVGEHPRDRPEVAALVIALRTLVG